MTDHLDYVLYEVGHERLKQEAKWGEQSWPDGTGGLTSEWWSIMARRDCQAAHADGRLTYRHILDEEVHEAFAETDPEKLKAELIQVAAVAVAWVEKLIREESRGGSPVALG